MMPVINNQSLTVALRQLKAINMGLQINDYSEFTVHEVVLRLGDIIRILEIEEERRKNAD